MRRAVLQANPAGREAELLSVKDIWGAGGGGEAHKPHPTMAQWHLTAWRIQPGGEGEGLWREQTKAACLFRETLLP